MQLAMSRTQPARPILAIAAVALLILAVMATALYVGSQRRESSPFRNGAIVYAQGGDLFIADQLDGTPRTLVAGPGTDSDPLFSDQGDRIAFVRDVGDHNVPMTVRPDGSDIKALATPLGLDNLLGWSPDGGALLVSTHRRDDSRQIEVVRSDGSGSQLLAVDASLFTNGLAAWRPDGRHIAVRVELDGGLGIYIADANGTSARPLPIRVGLLKALDWSPDGNHLSFTRSGFLGADAAEINIADIDENGTMTQLHTLPLDPKSFEDSAAKWSPDGSQLAFVLIKGSRSQIGLFNPDGSGYRILVPDAWDEDGGDIVWSPDGRSLVLIAPRLVRSVDVATGKQTEVQTPVESWQRLAP